MTTSSPTSIVVVNWNTRDVTLRCVDAVRAHTHEPYELVLVDNGSEDGSAEALAAQEDERTRVLLLPENLGFAGGSNRGLEAARGAAVCLLNSDTRVTRGWLRALLAVQRRTGAGLVGPCTNKAKGRQRRRPLWKRFPPPFRGDEEVEFLSFFCVLLSAEARSRVGPLDERFGFGLFEDDDYCQRTREAGLPLWIAGRSWVWHDAHSTFVANGVDHRMGGELMERNRALYERKWEER